MSHLQRSGAGIFDRSSPDGYPDEDEAWSDTNAMVQRWRLARESRWALAGLVPGAWRYGDMLPEHRWRQQVIDLLAVRLTGSLLGPRSNEAAHRLLAATGGSRDERVQAIAIFIAQLPETQMR
jgi:hypothetical protein